MRRWLVTLACSALIVGCAAAGGPFTFTLLTSPPNYLAKVPLGASPEEVMRDLGPPKTRTEVGGKDVWSYEYGEGYGLRHLSFEFVDGKLYDVRYNDQGPYNGSTARSARTLE
jgi:hypothetical protein